MTVKTIKDELLAKRCGEGCCAAPFAVFKRFFAAGA